jgi:hypothetical protein
MAEGVCIASGARASMTGNRNGNSGSGFMGMTRPEIAQLKEELTADYKRKLEALELVEQMLNQQQKSPSPTGSRNKVQPAKVRPSAKVSGTTIAARIEQAFQKQPDWTTTALMSAISVKHRASLWHLLNRLVKERKIRVSNRGGGRHPVVYTTAIK